MDEKFRRFFQDILKHEGGYVNHPNDRGGETKYGISKRQYPNLDIKNLTKEEAMKIYYEDYWVKSDADKISEVSFQIATKYCDICVNMGIQTGRRIYLWALENVGNSLRDWDIQKVVDETKRIVNIGLKDAFIGLLCLLQKQRYEEIVRKNPSQRVFLSGWMKRAEYRGVSDWG